MGPISVYLCPCEDYNRNTSGTRSSLMTGMVRRGSKKKLRGEGTPTGNMRQLSWGVYGRLLERSEDGSRSAIYRRNTVILKFVCFLLFVHRASKLSTACFFVYHRLKVI